MMASLVHRASHSSMLEKKARENSHHQFSTRVRSSFSKEASELDLILVVLKKAILNYRYSP